MIIKLSPISNKNSVVDTVQRNTHIQNERSYFSPLPVKNEKTEGDWNAMMSHWTKESSGRKDILGVLKKNHIVEALQSNEISVSQLKALTPKELSYIEYNCSTSSDVINHMKNIEMPLFNSVGIKGDNFTNKELWLNQTLRRA